MTKESQTPFKRISAIILLLLFSYNAVFSHVSLWLWKVYINEQIEELAKNLPNESLEQIVLPDTGNPEHEIARNGVMYDVIRFEQQGNTIRYFCVKDFTESILFSIQNDDLSTKSFSAKQQWAGHAKQLQKNVVAKYLASSYIPILFPTPGVHIHAVLNLSTLANTISISTPPPDQKMI
ncbi:MAG: hypothetical protein V4651_08790 [Bacteroidota bacterium]